MQLHLSAAAGDVNDVECRLQAGEPVDTVAPPTKYSMDNGFTALMHAVRSPHAGIDMLDLLLDAGADPSHACDPPLVQSPLMLAVSQGELDKLRRLLAAGADARFHNNLGISAFSTAVCAPATVRMTMVRELLDAGADPLSSNPGLSPLELASECGNLDVVRFLLEIGIPATLLKWTPLAMAIALGTIDDVEKVLSSAADLNVRDHCGRTPMLLAAHVGDIPKVEALYAAGGLLTDSCHRGIMTMLWYAMSRDDVEMTTWLIRQGINAHESETGDPPLFNAASFGATRCVAALLAAGVATSYPDGNTALRCAANAEVVRLLVAAGEDIDTIFNDGYGLLKLAAEKGNIEMIRALLAMGAAVDATRFGDTALHKAVQRDHREIVRMLLAAGANPNPRDMDGRTPLFFVKSAAVTRVLLDAGADPHHRR